MKLLERLNDITGVKNTTLATFLYAIIFHYLYNINILYDGINNTIAPGLIAEGKIAAKCDERCLPCKTEIALNNAVHGGIVVTNSNSNNNNNNNNNTNYIQHHYYANNGRNSNDNRRHPFRSRIIIENGGNNGIMKSINPENVITSETVFGKQSRNSGKLVNYLMRPKRHLRLTAQVGPKTRNAVLVATVIIQNISTVKLQNNENPAFIHLKANNKIVVSPKIVVA
jgi:hypothetical protein